MTDAVRTVEHRDMASPSDLTLPRTDLDPARLYAAYAMGCFPMDDSRYPEREIEFRAPAERGIVPLEQLSVSAALERKVRHMGFELGVDRAFDEVMDRCAIRPREGAKVWITERLKVAYRALHERGLAVSFEAWDGDDLVAGIFGPLVGRAFLGESQFHTASGAGTFLDVRFLQHLRDAGYELVDLQSFSPHWQRFGAIQVGRDEYEARLRAACVPHGTLRPAPEEEGP